MFCLNLTSEHQAEASGNIGDSPKTNDSYPETQTAGRQAHAHTQLHHEQMRAGDRSQKPC